MKQIALSAVFIFFICVAAHAADSSVPPLINYQGMLTDADGNSMIGTKRLEFNLYDASAGGNKVWGPQVFNSVPLINGRFNVILGTTDTEGRSLAGAFSSKERFLGIRVDSGTELAPRQQILSAPFAISADHASESDHAFEADHASEADTAKTVNGPNLSVDPETGNTSVTGNFSINKNLIINGGIKTKDGRPPVFVSVVGPGCGTAHPYLGCPAGYVQVGSWYVGTACGPWPTGQGYDNGSIATGWMGLCVSESLIADQE